MSKNIKKIISYFFVAIFMFEMMSNVNVVNAADITSPTLTISGPSSTYVQDGGTVKYTLVYTDNVGVTDITLTRDDVILVGFTATTSATKNGNTVTVTASNVKATNNSVKYIIINSGSAKDAAGNVANRATSDVFRMPEMVNKDTTAPKIAISGPSSSTVYNGGSIDYTVTYSDNVAIGNVTLNPNDITLNGFSASKNVSIISNYKAIISLTNIQGSEGTKSISIAAGTAKDTSSNSTPGINSNAFALVEKTVTNNNNNTSTNTNNSGKNTNTGKNTTVNNNSNNNTNTEQTNSNEATTDNNVTVCEDFGFSVNNDITTFSSWLKSKKENTPNVQKYNYLANGEELVYYIDYYNGSNEDISNVNLKITIPFDVDVKEMSNNGKVTTDSNTSTVIEWNLDTVKSKQKCRLMLRVKFNRDIELMNSSEISKIFYTELASKVGENVTYSYLRQVYIDNSVTKVGTFANTLMFLDTTNSLRQNDEITRAELAKMILDSGLIKVDYSLDSYKEYNDYNKIPVYSKLAISNLKNMNLFEVEDNNFSPNNPVIRDEFYKLIINLISKISESKINVQNPIYLNEDIIKNSDGSISEYKNYIIELTRLNILPEYKTTLKLDEYVKRSEALAIINAIAFKSNDISNYPKYEVNYLNINNLRYLYNFTSKNNTSEYQYNYDDNLAQKIIQK